MRIRQLAAALCHALSEFEPSRCSGEQSAELADCLARAAKACQNASARAAARALDCGAATDASWLARASGTSLGEARTALETVANVAGCPATRDALAARELSLQQAA